MGQVHAGMVLSLDGFVRGHDGKTALQSPAFDELMASDLMQEVVATTGAVVMGRTTYELSSGDYTDYEFQVPLFVVTHKAPETKAKGENDKLSITFVTDGVKSAIEKARTAAGEKNVVVVGGANVIQQCLNEGLIDELQIDLMPVLLGDGLRLFEHLKTKHIRLERVKVVEIPGGGLNIAYRVLQTRTEAATPTPEDTRMSQNTPQRLYLMQVGIMPEYEIPIVCYLVQTGDGKNILIDSGLPEIIPEDSQEFENGQDVIQQLASIGLKPDDIDTVISTHYDGDHAGRHAAFTKARYVVQRAHHSDAATNLRYASVRAEWDQPLERIQLVDGDTELLPGLELIETSGHVPGHQSVLVRLPSTGTVLLTIDAVPFSEGFTRDAQGDSSDPDAEAIHASTIKLLDWVEREHIELVIFGHDPEQWKRLRLLPQCYE